MHRTHFPHVMRIPDRLREKLAGDHALSGSLDQSIAQFEPWLTANQVVFFEEYTNHDIRHVEEVLMAAASLVRDEAWPHVTATDAYVLVLATLLHDAGMHLSREGFVTLVTTSRAKELVDGWGDTPWDLLWERFLAEARRFSGKQLHNLFGDTDPVREPPLYDPQRMDGRDFKLIGEFLRRHHHRLAHEIVIFGVPGPDGRRLRIRFEESERDIAGLAGLVARSHGMPMRATLDHLARAYDLREFQGTHAVFLMATLRIADYLQIHRERAPHHRLHVSNLRSPVSRGEWAVHHAIRSVKPHDDPEAIWVEGRPEKVEVYLRLRELVAGIQHELDSSWAVLGEVYGRFEREGWSKFGLALRRIRSNLDDEASFAKSVLYHPRRAALEADADLLKLLVRPLYGNHPEIGVRELIQNGVDAVRERTQLVERYPELGKADLAEQEGDVVVWLRPHDETAWLLSVTDRGIGMTEEMVTDYFLKAGASFRTSRTWQEEFTDRSGKSTVFRSGRFGIGALAAFLLGDEITVTTRHVSRAEGEGVQFSATLQSDVVELTKVRCPVGTSIVFRVSPVVAEALRSGPSAWDWYCLDWPSVVRKVGATGYLLLQEQHLPDSNANLPVEWRRARHPRYHDVLWTYAQHATAFACNGFRIDSAEPLTWSQSGILFKTPRVSVFDAEGHLTLDVHRTATSDTYADLLLPLLKSVVSDFLAFLLARITKASDLPSVNTAYHREHRKKSGGIITNKHLLTATETGILLNSPQLIRSLGLVSAFIVIRPTSELRLRIPEGSARFMQIHEEAGPWVSESLVHKIVSLAMEWQARERHSAGTQDDWYIGQGKSISNGALNDQLPRHPCQGVRVFARKPFIDSMLDGGIPTGSRRRSGLRGWDELTIGKCPPESVEWSQIVNVDSVIPGSKADSSAVVELCFDRGARLPVDPIVAAWEELLGSHVIFWDQAQRGRQIRECWPVLGDYLVRYGIGCPDNLGGE